LKKLRVERKIKMYETLEDLDNGVLCKVFQHVPPNRRIPMEKLFSRCWKDQLRQSWREDGKSIDFSQFSEFLVGDPLNLELHGKIFSAIWTRIQNRVQYLKLAPEQCTFFYNFGLQDSVVCRLLEAIIASVHPQLRIVNLEECEIMEDKWDSLRFLLKYIGIKTIFLGKIELHSMAEVDQLIAQFRIRGTPSLRLRIQTPLKDDFYLKDLVEKIPHLRALNLELCKIREPSLFPFLPQFPFPGQGKIVHVEGMKFSHLEAFRIVLDHDWSIDLIGLCGMQSVLDPEYLSQLFIGPIGCVLDDTFSEIELQDIVHFPKLKKLELCQIQNVTDTTMEMIAQGCSQLMHLYVNPAEFGSRGLSAIGQNCPHLETIHYHNGPLSIDKIVKGFCYLFEYLNVHPDRRSNQDLTIHTSDLIQCNGKMNPEIRKLIKDVGFTIKICSADKEEDSSESGEKEDSEGLSGESMDEQSDQDMKDPSSSD
jgi:hypothetical protein